MRVQEADKESRSGARKPARGLFWDLATGLVVSLPEGCGMIEKHPRARKQYKGMAVSVTRQMQRQCSPDL